MESYQPEVKEEFTSHTNSVETICFSPDQTKLCSAGYDRNIILTNLQNNQTEKVFTVHESNGSAILGSDFSCNGEFLGTNWDETIRIWKVSGSESAHSTKLEGHNNIVNCILYLRKDPNHVISGSDDETIKLWSVERKREVSTLGCTSYVLSVDILPDNRTLVSAGGMDERIKIWDLRSRKCVQRLNQHADYEVNSVQFHPNSFSFASGSDDGYIKIIDFRTFKTLQEYDNYFTIRSVCFHPSGKYLLSGSMGKIIKVFDLHQEKNKVLFALKNHRIGGVNCVIFNRWKTICFRKY